MKSLRIVAQLCILFFCTGLDAGAQTNSPKKIRVAYDGIFVGSPYWWATIASPFTTFLALYDFSDKTIVPFMTSEGSRMGHTESDIRKLCPKVTVLEGLPVRGSNATSLEEVVRERVQKLKLVIK
ncbi:flavodoxin [Odoribacter laneus]|uniref:flavodoxin n=1 Tax=Odoribacter laneus TaxID=626933 RepID=UPI003AF58064